MKSPMSINIEDALNILLKRMEKIVEQVEGMTMERALENCFIIYCMDGAEHDNTGNSKANVITYSLT